MLESIEKLRKMDDGNLIAMEDGEYVQDTRHDRIADEIEAEIAERYIELPMDADGVTIHLGDELEIERGGATDIGDVTDIHLQEGKCAVSICFEYDSGVTAYPEDYKHHVKPRTLEDVLESFIEDYDHWDEFEYFGRGESRKALFARYADEFRKAAGE